MSPKKPAPQRSCVACKTKQDKKHLIRIVRGPEGEVQVDPSGKMPGRGAYLCQQESCIALAEKTGRLQQALKTQVPSEIYQDLKTYASKDSDHA